MAIEFILDTNAYRTIIEGLSIDDTYNLAKRLQALFDRLNDGRMESLLGGALLLRAHQIMERKEVDKDAESKLPEFIENYRAALIMNCTLLQSIGNGAEKLGNIDDERWNTLNDVQILFGALYRRDGKEKKLVTNEKKMKESCAKAGIDNAIVTFDEYKL